MNDWLALIAQYAPYAFGALLAYRYGQRLENEMKILNMQLEQLAEAAARHITKTASPQELQAAAANTNPHRPECACEDCCYTASAEQPIPELPVATARFVK